MVITTKKYFCLFMLGVDFVACVACTTFNQKVIVKRDRYGESPVVDMRSGASALESMANSDKREEQKERKEQKDKKEEE